MGVEIRIAVKPKLFLQLPTELRDELCLRHSRPKQDETHHMAGGRVLWQRGIMCIDAGASSRSLPPLPTTAHGQPLTLVWCKHTAAPRLDPLVTCKQVSRERLLQRDCRDRPQRQCVHGSNVVANTALTRLVQRKAEDASVQRLPLLRRGWTRVRRVRRGYHTRSLRRCQRVCRQSRWAKMGGCNSRDDPPSTDGATEDATMEIRAQLIREFEVSRQQDAKTIEQLHVQVEDMQRKSRQAARAAEEEHARLMDRNTALENKVNELKDRNAALGKQVTELQHRMVDAAAQPSEVDVDAESNKWTMDGWLRSLPGLIGVLSEVLAPPAGHDAFEYTTSDLHDKVEQLLIDGDATKKLAATICEGIVELSKQEAATGEELASKFKEGAAFELKYADTRFFYGGLEKLIGPALMRQGSFLKQVQYEHCDSEDSAGAHVQQRMV